MNEMLGLDVSTRVQNIYLLAIAFTQFLVWPIPGDGFNTLTFKLSLYLKVLKPRF